jgi:integrase
VHRSRPDFPTLNSRNHRSLYRILRCSALGPRDRRPTLGIHLKAHQAAGFEDSPASTKHFVVGQVLKGARRTLGVAQKCKDPLLVNDIRRLLEACPKNLLGLRDRALILIGFVGAFRRSELCAMTVSDLSFSASGLVISVPRSKADQEQAGDKVAIPFGEHDDTYPIRALRQWPQGSQRHRRCRLSRSRSSRQSSCHRIASRLDRSYLQNCRVACRYERHQHRRAQRPRRNGNTSCTEWIFRTHDRENDSSSFASCVAALHPARRDVPRKRIGEPRALISLAMRGPALSTPAA